MRSTCGPTVTSGKTATQRLPVRMRAYDGFGPFIGGDEPPLSELIDDPIFRCLLDSDGVRPDRMLEVIADTRAKLARR